MGRKSGLATQKSFWVRTRWSQFRYNERNRGYNPYENVLSPSNAAGLNEAWKYATGNGINSSPAVANGMVYVGSLDHSLYALAASTGALKWSYAAGDYIWSSPAMANGIVYFGSNDHKLYALAAATGAFKWSYAAEGAIHSSPTLANGICYVGSSDGKLYALNAITGAFKWSYATGRRHPFLSGHSQRVLLCGLSG